MLYTEIAVLCCETQTANVSSIWAQNAEVLVLKLVVRIVTNGL